MRLLLWIVALLCLVSHRFHVGADVKPKSSNKEITPGEGEGGDYPKLIFDKGVLMGVDKQHIDYMKPGR